MGGVISEIGTMRWWGCCCGFIRLRNNRDNRIFLRALSAARATGVFCPTAFGTKCA